MAKNESEPSHFETASAGVLARTKRLLPYLPVLLEEAARDVRHGKFSLKAVLNHTGQTLNNLWSLERDQDMSALSPDLQAVVARQFSRVTQKSTTSADGVLTICKGVSFSFHKEVWAAWQNLQPEVKNFLSRKNRAHIIVARTQSDIWPDGRYITEDDIYGRNYPDQKVATTTFSINYLGDKQAESRQRPANTIRIAETGMSTRTNPYKSPFPTLDAVLKGDWHLSHSPASHMMLHELGHVIDNSLNQISLCESFRKLHERDVARLGGRERLLADGKELAYFVQNDWLKPGTDMHRGRQEAFAECWWFTNDQTPHREGIEKFEQSLKWMEVFNRQFRSMAQQANAHIDPAILLQRIDDDLRRQGLLEKASSPHTAHHTPRTIPTL